MTSVIQLGAPVVPARAELLDHPQVHLIGATLRWKRYRCWTATGPSGSCAFYGETFTESGAPGLNSGHSVVGGGSAGQDDYRWICAVCYEIGRDRFCWTVLDTRGDAVEPPDLLGTMPDWMARPARADGEDVQPETADLADPSGLAAPLLRPR
jgi:hypothetical protein